MNRPEDDKAKGKEKQKYGHLASVDTVWRLLSTSARQNDVLKRAFFRVMKADTPLSLVISTLIYRINESYRSLLVLAKMNERGDCYVLARSIFETIVNACFLCAGGEETVQRAQRHALQKSYRDLDLSLEINKRKIAIVWSEKQKLEKSPELKAALAEFTNKKGREIIPWTRETIKEKIIQIDKKYGHGGSAGLQGGLFGLYRHASDITHGTFFGALFWLGETQPPEKPRSGDELAQLHRQTASTILILMGFCMCSLVYILDREFSLPDIKKESEEIRELYSKEACSQQSHDSADGNRGREDRGGFHWTVGDGSGKDR